MTNLELVKALRELCGIAGSGPTSVIAQTGESLRLVNWIGRAWNEIQSEHDVWQWMRKEFSFATTLGKNAYLPSAAAGEVGIADLASWHTDTLRLYTTAIGRSDDQYLVAWDYASWRDSYDFGSQVALRDRPVIWAERASDKALLLGPNPDGIYTVYGQYQASPTAMTLDADVPAMPTRFHMLIVYRAMRYYAAYEAASEVEFEGRANAEHWMSLLERDQLPALGLGGPLA